MFSRLTLRGPGLPGKVLKYLGSMTYHVVSDLPVGGDDLSVFEGASPAVINGEVWAHDPTTTTQGWGITGRGNGTYLLDSGGSTAFTQFNIDVFSFTMLDWHGLTVQYDGNTSPSWIPTEEVVLWFPKNVAISPAHDLAQHFNEVDGHALTIDVPGLPPGMNDDNSDLGGTPSTDAITVVTATATDPPGGSAAGEITIITGQVTVPNVSQNGTSIPEGTVAFAAVYLTLAEAQPQFHASVAFGDIISQLPVADAKVDPFTTVTVVRSKGPGGQIGSGAPRNWVPVKLAAALRAIKRAYPNSADFIELATVEADNDGVWARRNAYGKVRVIPALVPTP